MTLTLAIVGRPNVGKSTLFNRLTRKSFAIVHDTPGVTRDFREAPGWILDQPVILLDTAGLEESFDGPMSARMRAQTERALARADAVLFVIDARSGVVPMDQHFAAWLRTLGKRVVLVANKCESEEIAQTIQGEAFALGFGEAVALSASHGWGIEDLHTFFEKDFKKPLSPEHDTEVSEKTLADEELEKIEGDLDFDFSAVAPEDETKPIKIAIVGRPNVGKSTLMNALLGEDRVMTGPEAGITRDAIAVSWMYKDRAMRLVDTAGLRRKARVDNAIEKMSAADTLRAIRLAQLVLFVIDGTVGLEQQDLQIASMLHDEGRAIVLVVNKWDAVSEKEDFKEALADDLKRSFAQIDQLPMVFISALSGKNLNTLMDEVLRVYALWGSRVSTGKLNRWLSGMEQRHPPPLVSGKPQRLRYITQIKSKPPTFALWCSRPDDLPQTYQRYLINGLRTAFDLSGIPLRLHLRRSKNPFIH